ncbi:uncharacterized protein SPPG_06960 [Spizellomyces punctatus DAOM BR117]|uniref:Uncharacterized protein n=1 Tax=Spizellomyces punctatus (strain DAOM BR117) TaxID=645134 RepID=A0A0L0HAD6_SPIPD|nr:uncharacterized protein SPPG_06960 [Spizellomyces punctatus DAOM BR117]KNC97971.1 hypothetical protein SPPG_06960 [Spizellomyces punctatus DAOM BR117]|eukprot:XP_016606011.1 hypothetical protein SPPG_06960 [Spizellomyces punctatus DAOM BR117]
MVLGIIGIMAGAVATPLSVTSVPTSAEGVAVSTVGTAQSAASQGQNQGQNEGEAASTSDPRLAKFTLVARCEAKSKTQVDGKCAVLRKGKLYLDDIDPDKRQFPDGHPFDGFYLEYPFKKGEGGSQSPMLGLVSTIRKNPPELNWIYVDANTLELKYGNKTQSLPHITGPWDWTDDQEGLTIEGWEGFVALEESSEIWALYYDEDDDHLAELRGKRRVLECMLDRQLL